MQFSILLALAPAVAVVSALPNPDGYGPTTTACVPKTIYTTSVGHSESCYTSTSTAYKPYTEYNTVTYSKVSYVPVPYSVVETSYKTNQVSCPYTSKSTYYETKVETKTKDVPTWSYTPTTVPVYTTKPMTSTLTKPYEECVTSAVVKSSPSPVYITHTSTMYYSSVYPISTSTCAAPGYGYGY